MCQHHESKSRDEQMTEEFFDFDGASSGTSWISMTGANSVSNQGMRHRAGSVDPVIGLPSSSTVFGCSDTVEGFDGPATNRPALFAPMLLPAPGSRGFQGTNQAMHGQLEPAQPVSQMESEVAHLREFVSLREIELPPPDISPNSFAVFQESIRTDQAVVSLKQVNPLPFGGCVMDTTTPVAANPAVMDIATPMVSPPFKLERPKDMTLDQGNRMPTPPRGGVLIPDLLGCSPWPGQRRTEQDQREREKVTNAGGSCLLCTFRHKKVSNVIIETHYNG